MNDDVAVLLTKVALRDRTALAELYRKTSPKLFGLCIRLLKDKTEAEDALQDIFVKIWQKAESFAASGHNAMAWLSAIARYHCIDKLRVRAPIAHDIDEHWDIADTAPNPEQATSLRSEGKRIDRCMEELEASKARAVRAAYVEGASYQELADSLGVPLNTVRTWLRRSLLSLRECLER
ncbi:sigma-70 family RNA polymerase sigma factor [Allorhizobium terrae]|uniref:Sigma-70 family RNA polymerase sigma factor n=1 Tax=Allorhizobium terrae TaxID=1848972 RepID=A0A4S3ZXP8_9HYPH|nr:sigma-70 family RNA polymerase sigma factor [Allorhizobium terrae]THF50693.1 sigma-70 family RNA polymerase sigma factor [Allorhizobium terrae]TWD55554.1 RNA polymerase sigma-70 factor (ECF subfamily) [Agrobacterium vitis]